MKSQVDLNMVVINDGWTTYRDVVNKLVVHVYMKLDELQIDEDNKDPDGLPLVHFEYSLVTRTRKMTDEEFFEALKILGMNAEKEQETVLEKRKEKVSNGSRESKNHK